MSIRNDQLANRGDEGRYRLLVDNIVDYAIYMLDTNGFVASWNQGAERFKGYTASEIIGQHFSRFYTEEDRKTDVFLRRIPPCLNVEGCEDIGV